jgi:DNA-binding transcriptional LysR family regulator
MVALASVDLNLLIALRALLRQCSVTRAAVEAGVSQPAMSSNLRRLRHILGDELLVRVGKTYELTARASALLEPLESALRTIDNEVINTPVFVPADSRRIFTVASSNAAAATILSGLARRFGDEAPHATLHVVALVRAPEQLLGDNGCDLVLLPETIQTTLPRQRLYDDEWVCVVDVDNSQVGDELRLEDLVRLPHIVFDMTGVSVSAELTLQAAVPERRIRAVVSDFLTIPFLLRGTPMISVLQGRVARLLGAHGMVRVLRCPVQLPALGVDMVWNPRAANDPACVWLRTQLVDLV